MLIHLEKDSKSKQTPEKIERKKEIPKLLPCNCQWQLKGGELELTKPLNITSLNKVRSDIVAASSL